MANSARTKPGSYGAAAGGNSGLSLGPEKSCGICKLAMSLSAFYLSNGKPHSYCKVCDGKRRAQRYRDNAVDEMARQNARRLANRDHVLTLERAWRAANKEKCNAKVKKWRKANKDYDSFRVQYRKAMVRQAIPKWGNKSELLDAYKEARCFGLHVDHIVPLTSDIVCGLHVFDNLQLISLQENTSKGNRRWPDQP